jgi:predicted DNA-binding protein
MASHVATSLERTTAWNVSEDFHTSQTLTIRLAQEQAEWLQRRGKETGRPQGRIVRDQIEQALEAAPRPFMKLAELASRYRDRNPNLADLCLIRMSELHPRHPVITVNAGDFRGYIRDRRERDLARR